MHILFDELVHKTVVCFECVDERNEFFLAAKDEGFGIGNGHNDPEAYVTRPYRSDELAVLYRNEMNIYFGYRVATYANDPEYTVLMYSDLPREGQDEFEISESDLFSLLEGV